MLSLLTRTKSFRDPWVGHPMLNRRWQLHRRRVQLADSLCRWRRWLQPSQRLDLERDGFLVIPNLLPDSAFIALRNEVEDHLARANAAHPLHRMIKLASSRNSPSRAASIVMTAARSTVFCTLILSSFPAVQPSAMTLASVTAPVR